MIKKALPFLAWFDGYSKGDLRVDALAGLTVALVLIPQSMAYAALAGLPAHYGLYAAFLPPLVAALFGSSRQLSTGPVAVVSLMTAASLEPLASAGSTGFITYAILLALVVGVIQLALGLLRLGLVVNFLSHPVALGFTNAAALIIATSQLSSIFGVTVEKAEHHYESIIRVFQAAAIYTHLPSVIMAAGAFVVMFTVSHLAPRLPGVLMTVVLATLISWGIGYDKTAEVPLSSLHSELAGHLIDAYNQQTEYLNDLRVKKTEAYQALQTAPAESLSRLDALRGYEIVATRLDIVKFGAEEYRRQIRRLLFAASPGQNGALEYHPRDEPPKGVDTDGRTWRIKVGRGAIDPERIRMTGGGDVVGSVPRGLPSIKAPRPDFETAARLLPYAAIIALLGFMEAVSVAKAMAARTGHRLDPNQELIGQGLANIVGAFGQSYATSGSFSRSAVNLQAGAVSGLSSVFTSLIVAVTLLFLTPLLYHLPQAVLAAIIMMAVIGLINVHGLIHAWKAQWSDGFIAVVTFIATLTYAPHLDKGILIGVVLSLAVFLYRSMRPKVVSLSRAEDQSLHAALSHGLKECKYIDMIRFDGPLFFASAGYLEDEVIRHMQTKPLLKCIIVEASGINYIDASGEEALNHILERVRRSGVDLHFAGLHQDELDVLTRTGMIKRIGADHIYPNIEQALNALFGPTHSAEDEKNCPLRAVVYDDSVAEEKQNSLADIWKTIQR